MSVVAMRAAAAGSDRGSAVILALVATMLLAALGQGLVLLTNTEHAIAANETAGTATFYAADAALACVVSELRGPNLWSDVLGGVAGSGFIDGTRTPTLPSGAVLDLDARTRALQATSASDPWGANNPVWRLYAYGPLSRLTGTIARSGAYVAVWVADDPDEADNAPGVDSNDVLRLRATAFGPHQSERTIEVTLSASGGAAGRSRPRVVSWQEVR